MAARHWPQRLRQGRCQQKVNHRQQQLSLRLEPQLGLVLLTLRTVPIARHEWYTYSLCPHSEQV